jgi:hypothetical protein
LGETQGKALCKIQICLKYGESYDAREEVEEGGGRRNTKQKPKRQEEDEKKKLTKRWP